MITPEQYKEAADLLGVDIPAIKAVERVESSNSGFLGTGEPVILFEPHIFWKELRKRGIDPNKHVKGNEDILYPTWKPGQYGAYSKQHGRLQKAEEIHREAALSSASWGKFQIMGFNYKLCGCDSIQDFINKVYKDEAEHLKLFCNYIKSVHLDDELREEDWSGFAASYNGPLYRKNRYDIKLKEAYEEYKSKA